MKGHVFAVGGAQRLIGEAAQETAGEKWSACVEHVVSVNARWRRTQRRQRLERVVSSRCVVIYFFLT
jgi:hypothetical protein